MYRARVDSVSGVNVYAGGKWLRCIGNKTVRVGDYVWTDGRCVYGHNRQWQAPPVLTVIEEDEGIPIVIYDKESRMQIKYIYLPPWDIKRIQCPEDYLEYYLINDSKNVFNFVFDQSQGFHYYRYFSRYQFEFYYPIDKSYFLSSANIDKVGNVYKMRWESTNAYEFGIWPRSEYGVENEAKLIIEKNGEIIKSISEVKEGCYIPWGVIEDEDNWAFMLYGWEIIMGERIAIVDNGHGAYLYTPQRREEIYRLIGDKVPHSDNDYILTPPSAHIPIQDGYYFKINKFYKHNFYYERFMPEYQNISIYTPTGVEIFNGDFNTRAYITLYDGRLLGVNNRGREESDAFAASGLHLDTAIGSGLYFINNKELIPIAKGDVQNLKFRPMKHYNGWQNRMQPL